MEKYTYQMLELGLQKVLLRSDGASIPIDPSNYDYQAYLEHEAKTK